MAAWSGSGPAGGGDALVGAAVAGGFGLAWAFWGASGLSGAVSLVVRVAAIAIGVAIIARSTRLRRSGSRAGDAPAGSRGGSIFGPAASRRIVALELIALAAGAVVLRASGHPGHTIAWFAAVVGVHFIGFGHFFWRGFYVIGAILIAGAIAGAIVGLSGDGPRAVRAVAGLIAALTLLGAGSWTLLQAPARTS